jgi:hypothetical protein
MLYKCFFEFFESTFTYPGLESSIPKGDNRINSIFYIYKNFKTCQNSHIIKKQGKNN